MAAPGFLLRNAQTARRLVAVSATAAALGAASFAAVPAAQAAAGAAAPGTVARAASLAGHQAIPARAIRCKVEITLVFPHPIRATGELKCSGRVPRLTLTVRIFRNGHLIKKRVFTRTQVRTLEGAVSVACRSGRYRATAGGKVKLKSGRILTGHVTTRRVRVHC